MDIKIFLIGMPGSGKSFFGKKLADYLNLHFFDLDAEIEKREGKNITDIFSSKGESYFRQVESETLNYFLKKEDSYVLSTGGGTPCFHDGLGKMNDKGITLYLKEDFQTLVSRVEKNSKRPLLEGDKVKNLEKLLNERSATYERAHLATFGREADQIAADILAIKN